MTHQLLEKIRFPSARHINLVVDRCKNNLGIKEFKESKQPIYFVMVLLENMN